MVLVVLSSVIFSLKSVEVIFLSNTDTLTGQEETILESGRFNFCESVFLSNKKEYTCNFEKSNPYLRVVNLETIFPSKLIVHAVERTECYFFKLSNGKYAVIDEHAKLLRISQTKVVNAIEIKNCEFVEQILEEGDFFKSNGFLKKLFNCFLEWKETPTYEKVKDKISSIEQDYQKTGQLLINMKSGVSILIENSNAQLSEKVNLAFSIYDTKTKNGEPIDYTQSGTIFVLETEQNIYALYRTE